MTDADNPPLITECPNCKTRFRVTAEQLDVAHGRVRCGACLAVFAGVDHLLNTGTDIATPERSSTLESVLSDLSDTAADSKDAEPAASTAASKITLAPRQLPAQEPTDWTAAAVDTDVLPVAKQDTSKPTLNDAMEDEEALRSWLEGELTGSHPAVRGFQALAGNGTEDELDVEALLGSNEDTSLDALEALLKEMPEEALHGDDAGAGSFGKRVLSELQRIDSDLASAAAELEASELAEPDTAEVAADVPPGAHVVDASIARGAVRRDPDAPREPVVQRPLRLASAVAFVLLTIQVLYSQFDRWGTSPVMRPVYSALCGVLRCELPERRDLALMESQRLTVRAHPALPDTLLVDALIVNRAAFDQPYPHIVLEFSDLNRAPLVTHELAPEDYLAGDADPDAPMPSLTPVHIDLDIPDPGAEAVNYQLTFR